jgi:hypothetical protein
MRKIRIHYELCADRKTAQYTPRSVITLTLMRTLHQVRQWSHRPCHSGMYLFSSMGIVFNTFSRSVRGNYSCVNAASFPNLGISPLTPLYQSTMPVGMQPLVPLQPPAPHGYNSYSSPINPGFQRMVPQTSPSSHLAPQHRQKASTSRPSSKSLSVPSSRPSNHTSSASGFDGRTIYIYNLPYTASQQAIKEHVSSVGVVDRCLVKEDRQRSSKYKLTAVVTFRTPQQAQSAIDQFNRSMWKGCEIKVRLDRGPSSPNASAVAKDKPSTASRAGEECRETRETREGPLVVNGSGPTLSNRQIPVDSDDESSCDECD